jgi:hypothetical protein
MTMFDTGLISHFSVPPSILLLGIVLIAAIFGIRNQLKRIADELKSANDLQRIRRDLSALDAEQSKKDEGSGKGRSEIVDPGASYGDLSRVGLLKKPKP